MPKLSESSVRKAGRQIMKRRWRQLARRAQRLRQRPDRARLHDFRVALRRVRATLALCEQQSGLAARKGTRRAIKELAAASGVLRDCEIARVQIAGLWPADADAKSDFAQNCGALLDLAQLRAQKNLYRILRDHQSVLKGKIRLKRRVEHAQAAPTMRQATGLHMLQLLGAVEEYALSPLMLPEPLHALRITVKNLRYTLESVARTPDEDMLEDLRRMQEHLGRIHDIDQTIVTLRRWEQQLVQANGQDSAPQYALLLQRAFVLRAERLADWLRDFPANGADLLVRLQERARTLAGPADEETVLT